MDAADIATIISAGIAVVVSIGTLIGLVVRGSFNTEKRLTTLETKIEPFWDNLKIAIMPTLYKIEPPGNPISSERYQYLLDRMNTNSLTTKEASELNDALLELQQQAKNSNDLTVLLAIGLALFILANLSKNK